MNRDSSIVNNDEKPVVENTAADSSIVNNDEKPVVENTAAEFTGGNLDESIVESGSEECTEKDFYRSVVESGSEECREGKLEDSVVKIESEECAGGSMDQPVMENSSEEVTIENLPTEIIIEIFSYIKRDDLAISIRHVSQRWQGIVDETESLWRKYTLQVADHKGMLDAISLVRNMPLLKRFNSRSLVGNGEEIVYNIASVCRVLTVMIMPNLWISGDCIHLIIDSLPFLTELHIALNSEMKHQIKAVSRSSKLETLHLHQHPEAFGQVTPGLLVPLAEGCPSLSVLFFNHILHQTQDINYLLEKKKHKLRSLGWRGSMHSSTFVCLGGCSVLNDVTLGNFYLTDVLPTSANIPEINLPSIEKISYEDSPIQYLINFITSSLPSLSSLTVKTCSGYITSALSIIFPRCQNLQSLTLSEVMILENVFTLIRSKVLKRINLGCCTHWGLPALKHLTDYCTEFTEFSISEVTITAEKGNAILNTHQLEKIVFSNCDLVEMNFGLLCQNFLPKLKYLKISCCIVYSSFFNRDIISRVRPEIMIVYN